MQTSSLSQTQVEQAHKVKTIVFDVTGVDVYSPKRLRHIVESRMIYAKLLRELGFTYAAIGRLVFKDHTTIIHYINVLEGLLKTDENILILYKRCENELMRQSEDFFLSKTKPEEETELVKVLRGKIERLTLEQKRTERFKVFDRLSEIIDVVNERTPKGKEKEVCNRIIRMFNGIEES